MANFMMSFLLCNIFISGTIVILLVNQTNIPEQSVQPDIVRAVEAAYLSAYFEGYIGSFVLYNPEWKHWHIYDIEHATTRVSPDSTFFYIHCHIVNYFAKLPKYYTCNIYKSSVLR